MRLQSVHSAADDTRADKRGDTALTDRRSRLHDDDNRLERSNGQLRLSQQRPTDDAGHTANEQTHTQTHTQSAASHHHRAHCGVDECCELGVHTRLVSTVASQNRQRTDMSGQQEYATVPSHQLPAAPQPSGLVRVGGCTAVADLRHPCLSLTSCLSVILILYCRIDS